ncbi:hypothetical protein GGQ94_003319 [Petrimonas sulfuriphila]
MINPPFFRLMEVFLKVNQKIKKYFVFHGKTQFIYYFTNTT